MNVLITGGLGNIGVAVTELAIERGHRVFVLTSGSSKRTHRRMRLFEGRVRFLFGDLSDADKMREVTADMDYVIHLAAVLPPASEDDREKTFAINVQGTQNLIDGIHANGSHARMIFSSSTSVMGPRHEKTPPVRLADEPNPINLYTASKLAAEKLLSESDIEYAILRLASVMTRLSGYNLKTMQMMFEFPLEGRNEIVLSDDTAVALLNCIDVFEKNPGAINRETFFIAGGKENGCQITNAQLFESVLAGLGIGMLRETNFIDNYEKHFMDWYDTSKSQGLLNYQQHTLGDYVDDVCSEFKHVKWLIPVFAPVIRLGLELLSPYGKQQKK